MNGLMTAPNGMNMQDYIYGWDLNNGRGFESFKAALDTQDDVLEWGTLWKINGQVYELVPFTNHYRPYFQLYRTRE